jgi:hypothetical protein
MKRTKDYKSRVQNEAAQRQHLACASSDELALFEQLKAEVLPNLLKDKKRGLTAKQILEKYQDLAAMKLITNMITEMDSAKSTAAATQILDRTVGKPTEKRETTHKHAALTDEQIDALLNTRIDESNKK